VIDGLWRQRHLWVSLRARVGYLAAPARQRHPHALRLRVDDAGIGYVLIFHGELVDGIAQQVY
jgi:hypothetical protein